MKPLSRYASLNDYVLASTTSVCSASLYMCSWRDSSRSALRTSGSSRMTMLNGPRLENRRSCANRTPKSSLPDSAAERSSSSATASAGIHRSCVPKPAGSSPQSRISRAGSSPSERASSNAMADPLLHAYAQQLLGAMAPAQETTVADRVRELVELLLPTGRCTVEQVARGLGVDRRTVHRKLARDGTTFTSMVDEIRGALAERLVANRRHSLTEVGDLLGFSSLSNFSRWFSARYGVSPRQWRQREATRR